MWQRAPTRSWSLVRIVNCGRTGPVGPKLSSNQRKNRRKETKAKPRNPKPRNPKPSQRRLSPCRHRLCRHRLRCSDQEADVEADLFGSLGSRHGRAFPWPRGGRQERRRRGRDPKRHVEPCRRQRDADRRPGRRSRGRQVLHQRPHRTEPGR